MNVNLNVALDNSSGRTVATITFGIGSHVDSRTRSLIDGNYELRVVGAEIHTLGVHLDGDNSGTAGGDLVFHGNRDTNKNGLPDDFFRLYGDMDGDGDVDGIDFAKYFSAAYGSRIGSTKYRAELDFDGDGDIDGLDFARGFSPRYGRKRPATNY